MNNLNFEYVPLTFISDKQEIKKQIRNTLILIYLFEKYNNPVRLEELIEGTQYGYNASALQSGNNKFLRISDIHESKVDWENVPYCNCDDEATYLLKNDDILIARTGGTTGKSFKISNPPKRSIYAGYLIRIRAKAEINTDYIYLFLHSFAYWSQIVNLNERNFRPKANAENLKSLILPDCPKYVQDEIIRISQGEKLKGYEELFQKIETSLIAYDKTQEVENLLQEQLINIENLNQSIIQEAVQGKLVKPNPKNEPASELLKRIKAEKGKAGAKEKALPPIKPEEIPFEIPNTWAWCRLGEITNYGSSPKAEPSDIKDDTWVLDLEDIEKTTSNLLFKMRFAERNSLSTKSIFKKGDVLYSKLRPYLDKVIVANEDGVCTTEILPLKCFGVINPFYLKYSLKRADFLNYVNSKTKGMKMPRLGTKEGQMALIPMAPFLEQKCIVDEIEKQLEKTKQLKEYIIANQQATEQLLKALLHQAFEVTKENEKIIDISKVRDIELPRLQGKEENHFVKRKVLATYIINQSLNDSQFGDVKFEKLLHLSDYFAIKRNLGQNYYQQAAGPYDNAFTIQYFKQVINAKWFNRSKKGRQYAFSAGQQHQKSLNTYSYFTDEELNRVKEIINYFKRYDYEQPEIVSTLYAIWNNHIIRQEQITDDLLIHDFYNWDEQKKKYDRSRLEKALKWMRDKSFIPDGWGKAIEKAKTKKRKKV